MKKRLLLITIACLLLFGSCIGPFSLSNKLLAWNQTIDNKFVNEIVFVALCIIPVYEVSFVIDIVVLNSIEFWTGKSPLETGIVKEIQGENGVYTVETLTNGYNITSEEGQQLDLIYDKETNTWSAVANEKTRRLIKIEDDKNSAIVFLPNGEERRVECSQNGVLAFRQLVESTIYTASR